MTIRHEIDRAQERFVEDIVELLREEIKEKLLAALDRVLPEQERGGALEPIPGQPGLFRVEGSEKIINIRDFHEGFGR